MMQGMGQPLDRRAAIARGCGRGPSATGNGMALGCAFGGMIEMVEHTDKTTKGHCPDCGPNRNAIVRGEHRQPWDEPETNLHGVNVSLILQCAGCDTVYFQRSESCSADYEESPRITHWPLPEKRARPSWANWTKSWLLDPVIADLLDEIYTALDNDLRVLATIGMRTALDRSMTLHDIDDGNFEDRLKEMARLGHITESQKTCMIPLKNAGNAAAHKCWKPDSAEIQVLMDIIESYLHHVFLLRKAAEALDGSIPKKTKAAKPSVPT